MSRVHSVVVLDASVVNGAIKRGLRLELFGVLEGLIRKRVVIGLCYHSAGVYYGEYDKMVAKYLLSRVIGRISHYSPPPVDCETATKKVAACNLDDKDRAYLGVALVYKERGFRPYLFTNDSDFLACKEFRDFIQYGNVEYALDRLHRIIGGCES